MLNGSRKERGRKLHRELSVAQASETCGLVSLKVMLKYFTLLHTREQESVSVQWCPVFLSQHLVL